MNVERSPLRVYTIGHSTRELPELVELLRECGVTELVDVRSFPSSRKFPQWNQANIEAELPSDISYTWLKDLGGRRHTPAGVMSPNTGWRVKAFRDYADYMNTEPFHRGLNKLIQIAEKRVPAIMCSEAVPWRCHRRLITDALLNEGIQVYDIISANSVRPAKITPFADFTGGNYLYPDPEPGQD